jgi:Hemerythrin HHE cation binding domain
VSDADKDRKEADDLPDGDVIAVLLRQHADIREGLDRVTNSKGELRRQNFIAIKAFLASHEAAEQSVIRPVSEVTAGAAEATSRNEEEQEADQVLAKLSALDVDSADFDSQFADFVKAVSDHAEAEEHEEFPTIEEGCSLDQRRELAQAFLAEFASTTG